MQFFKNKNVVKVKNHQKLVINTLEQDKFELNIILKESDENSNDVTFTHVFDKNDILNDHKTKKTISGAHILSCLFMHGFEDKIRFTDFFVHSKHNKGGIGATRLSLDIDPMLFVFIPFSDSPTSDWTVVVNSNDVTLDGEDLPTFNLDQGISISEVADQLLPVITLTKTSNEIIAQLNVAKSNVEIFFETTAGYLNKTRSLTDAEGKATVKVFGEELEGKVKAGFKNFSGKAEIAI